MNKLYTSIFSAVIILFMMIVPITVHGQMYNDGGLRLRVWAHKVWSAANCGDIGDQEYNIQDIRARVRDASGTGYITSPGGFNVAFWGAENRFYSFNPNQMNTVNSAGLPLEADGYKMLDVTYSGSQVPTEFQVYLGQAFEDDCYGDILSCGQGAPRVYDNCCCLFGVCALGDDYYAGSIGWGAVNFRGGNNGQVNYTLPVIIGAGAEHKYAVVFAYRWDWSPGLKPLCGSLPNYKDGNITVTADLVGVFNDMDWDGGTCGVAVGGNEDLRVKVLAKDNITAGFPSFPTGAGSAIKISQDVPNYNTFAPINVFNKTYTNETNFSAINLAWDLWEEDGFYLSILGFGISCGTDDNYEGSDYSFPWFCVNSDDAHTVTRTGGPGGTVNTGYTINWRDSPPNTYNYIEVPAVLSASSYQNWMLKIRYRWTISAPTVSIVTTDLHACLPNPLSLTATTSNATYYQWQVADINGSGAGSCPIAANWTNVAGAICPTITFPQVAGTRTYRLVVYNRNGAGSTTSSGARYDSAVSNCVRVTYFPYAPPIISTACGRSVPSGNPITFTVPSVPAINAIGDALAGWQYNWSISPTTNVAPTSATNSTTFTPTFTSAAAGTTYTVTLTVVDPCGAADATSTCTFTVTTPSCDLIYVAPPANGGSDANAGTASSPYATITNAINNISGSRNHIRIMGGATYSETQWLIPANAIIDGGWEIVNLANGDWRKNSSLTTTVNLNPGTENNGTVGYHRGIISNGNNWLMQDLTVNVKTISVAAGQYLSKGYSVYGVYINGNTGWEIKRSAITAGPGATGAAGTTPAGTGGSGVGGGAGGGGGNGSTAACGCSWGSGGGTGTAGNGGAAAGTGGAQCCGGGCNVFNCDASGCNAQKGFDGSPGGVGSTNWAFGDKPASPGTASPYFIPAGQSASGSNGFGGGGGGGGGGGDHGTCCTCSPCPSGRANGGTGGRGGNGGLPGSGGWGGGGSFGIYIVGNAAGTLAQSTFTAGAAGSGGLGATGQSGETGIGGNPGNCTGGCGSPTSNGCGGNGGKGGDGGPGGRGRDGADGISVGTVNLATTTANIVTIGVGASGAGGPNAVADYLKVRYNRGCTNSMIEISKSIGSSPPSGAFDFAVMGNPTLVNDESPNTTTYANTTGASTLQVEYTAENNGRTTQTFGSILYVYSNPVRYR
ncbi:MAG: hypothetical protein U0T77_10920 [Chitinophagales bacterium]